MFLRITKVVYRPRCRQDLLQRYCSFITSYLKPAEGNLCVRLFEDRLMPNKCIVMAYWTSKRAALEPGLMEIRKRELANLTPLLLERVQVWNLNPIDIDPRANLLYYTQGIALRIAKFAVQEGDQQKMLDFYRQFTNDFSRKQKGSIAVNLFQDSASDNSFFLESKWATAADLEAVIKSAALEGARLKAIRDYQQERMTIWDLVLLAGDERVQEV